MAIRVQQYSKTEVAMSQKPKLTLTLYPLYFKYEFDAIILITLFYASLVFGKLVVMMHEAE